MAWTTPRTWVPGEVLTSTLMNTHVRDNEQYLYDNLPVLPPNYQTVRGGVTNTGTVWYGSGFTVTNNGTGDYTVTYDVAMSAFAAVAATHADSSSIWAGLIVTGIDNTKFELLLRDLSNNPQDGYVSFIASSSAPS